MMDKVTHERRRTFRHDLRVRVHLYDEDKSSYQNAHLENINHTGIYLMTRCRLAINQKVEIEIPADSDGDGITIRARVMRLGRHRWWGLFSYGCHILRFG